jgi:zinc transporter
MKGTNEIATQKLTQTPQAADRVGTASRILPGLVFAFRFNSNGMAEKLGGDQPVLDYPDGWLWLHFDVEATGAAQSLDSIPAIPAPAKELLKAVKDRQQLYADDTCTYGVFADLTEDPDEATDDISFVQFAITEKLFVSSSRSQLGTLNSLKNITRDDRFSGPLQLFKVIIERTLDSVDQHIEALAKTIDDIEEALLTDESVNARQSIGQIRRTAVRLHRQIAISRSLVHRIEHETAKNEKLSLRFATATLSQRLDWLNAVIDALRERAQLLQEEAMLRTADQTNSHLQVLAIVATLFLPATLIAGIFGMNVKGLPLTENGNGFFWSMGLLVGSSALIFWLLKRSAMLRK